MDNPHAIATTSEENHTRHRAAPPAETEGDDIDVSQLLFTIARRWLAVALIALAGGALAFVLVSRSQTRYEAAATIAVRPAAASPADLSTSTGSTRMLLTNPNVVSEVLRETGLGASTSAAEFSRDAISIEELLSTPFLRLRVRAHDPAVASTAARLLVERAAALADKLDQEAARETAELLSKTVARAAGRLAEVETRLLDYRTSSGLDRRTQLEPSLVKRNAGASDRTGQPVRRRTGEGAARRSLDGPSGPSARGKLTAAGPEQLSVPQTGELARLETEYEVVRRVYMDLAEQYELARITADQGQALMRLLEPSLAPGQPLPKGRARKTVLGLIAGLLAGIALVVASEARRRRRPLRA